MICALTARVITEGKTDEFIRQFASGADNMPDDIRERFQAVFACQDVSDPNVVLTFGLFDGSIDELREIQSNDTRAKQLEDIDPLIEDVLIDGSFEVIREFVSEAAGSINA
jgi:acyl-CoA synthetase (AMP-forming)/AMP-acid ligase II